MMSAKVIQGSFLVGQPKFAPSIQPRIAAPPPIQAKAAAGPPVPAFAGRHGPPASAFAARPPGLPVPAFPARPAAVQRHGAAGTFPVEAAQLGLASAGGRPLPDPVRGKMEAALGADFSNVRVHVGPQAERIGAIAFTIGSDIYFAPGRYQPDTPHGQQLLGHELAHVVQQRAGRVRNPLGSGLAVVQDTALEAEADRLGRNAAAHPVAAQAKMPPAPAKLTAPVRISSPIPAKQDAGLGRPQSDVRNRSTAPLTPNRLFAARAVRPPPALVLPSAMQPYTILHHGAAQPTLTKQPVIQCWRCGECGREIAFSFDHANYCSQYHLREYETREDRAANYYDRPPGGVRTRSGSFTRQYDSGYDEHRHFHENRYGGGYVENTKGVWDPYSRRYYPQ
jgi:hypothetical protein